MDGAGMMEMYSEYSDAVTANEQPSNTKARLSALSAYAESQNLTGHVAFDGLLSLCSQLQVEVMDVRGFSIFYGFVFFMCREKGQKSISVTTAVNAWRLSLTGRFRLLDQWCAFVQIHQRHAISEDTWRQVLEFSRSVHEDLSNYDPEGAWPVLVDEFVDYMYRKNACSCCCKDTHGICSCVLGTTLMPSTSYFSRSSFNSGASTLPGMTPQVGSKRRWKDSSEDDAQVESVSGLSQTQARMPSPSSTKRMRSSKDVLAEMSDPMEGVDGDMLERQDSWEQSDADHVAHLFAHGSNLGQDPPSPASTSGDDVFLSPSWQPWPSQGRSETREWGQFNPSFHVPNAETPIVCGSYSAFLSPQQDLLLHK